MAIFEQIALEWDGRGYEIPAERVMAAIGVVEEVITFPELVHGMQHGRPNMSKLARAYGALLRYAGARIDDETIYAGMFVPGQLQHNIATAMNTLIVLMTPPDALKDVVPMPDAPGNLPAANLPKSSKRSTKRQ